MKEIKGKKELRKSNTCLLNVFVSKFQKIYYAYIKLYELSLFSIIKLVIGKYPIYIEVTIESLFKIRCNKSTRKKKYEVHNIGR